jgi:hypothetical protein
VLSAALLKFNSQLWPGIGVLNFGAT